MGGIETALLDSLAVVVQIHVVLERPVTPDQPLLSRWHPFHAFDQGLQIAYSLARLDLHRELLVSQRLKLESHQRPSPLGSSGVTHTHLLSSSLFLLLSELASKIIVMRLLLLLLNDLLNKQLLLLGNRLVLQLGGRTVVISSVLLFLIRRSDSVDAPASSAAPSPASFRRVLLIE